MSREQNKTKERDKVRIWDEGLGNQKRVQIVGDSHLVMNWMNGRWTTSNQKFRVEVQRTKQTLVRWLTTWICSSDIYRDWNEEADRLTHEAREKGACWNSFTVKEG